MADNGLRLHVERLLRRKFRTEDLTTLFLALRDRCDGREAVKEVGDFVAHRSERTKGVVTREVSDFFTTVRFRQPQGIDLDDLPDGFMEAMRASFRRLPSKALKQATGLRRVDAERELDVIDAKIRKNALGKSFLSQPTKADLLLVDCLVSALISRPAFDDERLFQEFNDSLWSNKILVPRESRELGQSKFAVTLYAMAYMHRSSIDLGDGSFALLTAASDCGDGCLGIIAAAQTRLGFPIASPIFTSSLRAEDHCVEELLKQTKLFDWSDCYLELSPDLKLSIIA